MCTVVLASITLLRAQNAPRLGLEMIGGHPRLSVAGDLDSSWTIQFSSNLSFNGTWIPLTNLTLSNNPTYFTDTSAPGSGQRFYRAVSGRNGPRLGIEIAGSYARLSVFGDLNSSWTIQSSTNLGLPAAWVPVTNLTLSASPTYFTDTSAPVAGRRFYRAVSQGQVHVDNTNLVWIPPGTFVMGSPTNEPGRQDDETQHTVTLTQGFYISKFLVTQAEYVSVMNYNPSYFNGPAWGTNLSRPVENLYWYAAQNYCVAFTSQEQQAGRLPSGWSYRLPTEAEWEYACRAGTTTAFSYGDDPGYTNLGNYAWYSDNSAGQTHGVGLKRPNPWGLYDVHGDVFEWCADWYGAYPTSPVTDPTGPDTGTLKVFRGGSYSAFYGPQYCRSAGRYSNDPTAYMSFVGFRVVAAPTR